MSTPKPNRKRIPPAIRRRALELLAGSRDGCTEAILFSRGFDDDFDMRADGVVVGRIMPVGTPWM
jgi:hypothetical protein